MIVIPTGTDAPIYHWPRVTAALILLNVVTFFVVPPIQGETVFDDNDQVVSVSVTPFERYALALGDGLHPVQWVTHNFLHYGFLHLLGNMIFLWAFGIVVEGKLGPVKYLLTYLAIGTLHGALTQVLLLRSGLDGHAAGASAVIYGLLAACMVWAPRNELNCLVILWFGFRILVYHWDLYFTTVALFYIGEQVLNLVVGLGVVGRPVVSEAGHLSGAFWGTVLAAGLVKAGWVDCEGWDIFALAAKRRRLAREWKERGERLDRQKAELRQSLREGQAVRQVASGSGEEVSPEQRAATALRKVHMLIDQSDFAAALAVYDRSARTLPCWPARTDLHAMIKAMQAKGGEAESVRLMRDHCRYYPDDSARVRLKLAQVLLVRRQRPSEALRVLAEVVPDSLPTDLEAARRQLVQRAQRLREEGVLELEGDD
jgi:membrane associated rhomboid family serine protease